MLRLIAATLDDTAIEFEVWQIERTYIEDDVTYIRPLVDSPHRIPIATSSICCATCAQEE